jgi:hypothetical protein
VKPRSRFLGVCLGRGKPRGAAGGRCTNTTPGRQGRSQGAKPRNRGLPGRSVVSATETTAGETVRGGLPVVTPGLPCGWRKLRRANPMSAAGAKQNRQGTEGRKPPRGSPNPEGGT